MFAADISSAASLSEDHEAFWFDPGAYPQFTLLE